MKEFPNKPDTTLEEMWMWILERIGYEKENSDLIDAIRHYTQIQYSDGYNDGQNTMYELTH